MDINKRNYFFMFLDPILFVNAMSLISINAVIPNFLNDLGASAYQISIAIALVSIGTFISQPLFAQAAMNQPNKSASFARLLFFQRLLFLAYVLSIPLTVRYNPGLAIVLFLLFWGIFNFFVGCYSPFYMSILYKVIPGNQRGRLIGYADSAGYALALGSAVLIGIILENMSFPYNYTCIFAIGISLLNINAWGFSMIREEPDKVEKKPIDYLRYIRQVPHALKARKEFAKTVIGNGFMVISNVALSFYALIAIRNFGAGPEQVAIFTGIGVIVNILASTVYGVIGDRFGHIYVLITASIFSAAAAIIVYSINALFAVNIGFALSSLSACGYRISSGINVMDHSPKGEIPLYISVNAMITLVASSLVTLMMGAIIDIFSFTPLYLITGICGAASFFIFYRICKEDRKRELITDNISAK
ncbi:MAG: MFS transporter [Caldicoprobacterales bacterium]|jgi:MFS family permease|nr:MFS transporter [Clostridiales bacterium]